MSKEKLIKEIFIVLVIAMMLFLIIHTTLTEYYKKHYLDYDKAEIEKVCFHPEYYDCESIIKIKDYCHYRPYYNRIIQCEINNGSG